MERTIEIGCVVILLTMVGIGLAIQWGLWNPPEYLEYSNLEVKK